ncbi:DNA-directed RNA polymerase sigma-70 factor [Actinoplanes capillaceus]|uniref:DNA-directed RNA polymerase sigma-70 factor n=1 Tax=Actinoplanes campanulatus TaxID=113559 RepID=A0ABQ3WCG9_9ACTN|nr:RNA polymerase sigma factor [Actinoplanes capillaceus]GID44719.1 DNA-directed RNA polymerase sigma-70 factor [Actinoplanes capillaceus]
MVASEDLDAVVSAAQAGDEEAFRRLYRAQQPALVRYLRVLVGDDAEDVASESWLQIARDLRKFSGDWDGFRGWTATIARHRAMDLLRAQRRRPQVGVPVEFLAEMSAGDDTADRALELVTTDDAVALIASLPPEMAEAVMLRVVVGLDATSTGRILGRRAGAVRTAAYRGLRQLAAKLAQRDPRHPPEPPRSPSWKPAVTTSAAAALKEMR